MEAVVACWQYTDSVPISEVGEADSALGRRRPAGKPGPRREDEGRQGRGWRLVFLGPRRRRREKGEQEEAAAAEEANGGVEGEGEEGGEEEDDEDGGHVDVEALGTRERAPLVAAAAVAI